MKRSSAVRLGVMGIALCVLPVVVLIPSGERRPLRDGVIYAADGSSAASWDRLGLLDIDTATREDVLRVFGEPEGYLWAGRMYAKDSLPDVYLMAYPEGFSVLMVGNSVGEYRFEGSPFIWNGRFTFGSPLEDVIAALGAPLRVVENRRCGFTNGVLYRNIDGIKGHCYYQRDDRHVRVFFAGYCVTAVYITRTGGCLSLPAPPESERIRDFTDYPFIPDPELPGTWVSVDFVESPEDFNPAMTYPEGDLFLHGLDFEAGGKVSSPYTSWTKGYVINRTLQTASAYGIRTVGGKKYLFLEWKSGDYSYRHEKPFYYVLERTGP